MVEMSPAGAAESDPRTSPPALPVLAFLPGGTPNGLGAIVADAPCLAACGGVSTPQEADYYYRARYYDPKVGRFISEDPVRFVHSLNLYTYVENMPTVLTDPTGRDWWDKAKTMAKAVGAAVGLYSLYKYCTKTVDCTERARKVCEEYEKPDWKLGPLGTPYNANYHKQRKCYEWAYNCCTTQAAQGGANKLIPGPGEIVPVQECDFSNPPAF